MKKVKAIYCCGAVRTDVPDRLTGYDKRLYSRVSGTLVQQDSCIAHSVPFWSNPYIVCSTNLLPVHHCDN